MKKDTHPTYFPEAKITCACGHVFIVGATKQTMEVEICSNCHPFYTGKEKLVDTAGRIEKYQTRVTKSSALKAHAVEKKTAHAHKVQKSVQQTIRPVSPKTAKPTKKAAGKK